MKGTACRRLWLLNVPLMATATPIPSHDLFVQTVEARLPGASTIALMSPDLAARRRTPGSGNDFPYVDHEKTNSIVGHVGGQRCSCRLSFCSNSSRINQADDGLIRTMPTRPGLRASFISSHQRPADFYGITRSIAM